MDVAGGPPLVVVADTANSFQGGSWSADGTILFVAAKSLRRVSASGGNPSDVDLEGSGGKEAVRDSPEFFPDGRHFLYVVRAPGHRDELRVGSLDSKSTTPAWFDRSGNALGSITQPAGVEYLNPSLSPDGTRLAVNSMDKGGNWDIWIVDLKSQIASRVTSDPAQDSNVVWSPDGNAIVFSSNRGGAWGLYKDGQRLLLRQPLGLPGPPVNVILNWTESLPK